MGWFRRTVTRTRRRAQVARDDRTVDDALVSHLAGFMASRHGVEAWVEGPTSMNKASILLIAHDGEWTRRSVPSTGWAHDFARRHQLPAYDAGVVAYPQRMRDWNARNKRRRP